MFGIFGKKNEEKEKKENIVVLKKTKPYTCGGTDATQDLNAPKEIVSRDMILFDVTSEMPYEINNNSTYESISKKLGYVSAFAVPAHGGTFLLLEKRYGYEGADVEKAWALVKENVFPPLVDLVNEFELAKDNGFHSRTHGLPRNFGGDIDIRYSSGEKISVSDNQGSVLSFKAGVAIEKLFSTAMAGEKIGLPDVSELKEIRFSEERENGGFTRAVLTISPDGTGINRKQSRYDDPKVFESEKPVDAETIEAIRKNIVDNAVLAWSDFPENSYKPIHESRLDFVFEGGQEISVKNDRELPGQISRGFFNIELEMTTKH